MRFTKWYDLFRIVCKTCGSNDVLLYGTGDSIILECMDCGAKFDSYEYVL